MCAMPAQAAQSVHKPMWSACMDYDALTGRSAGCRGGGANGRVKQRRSQEAQRVLARAKQWRHCCRRPC